MPEAPADLHRQLPRGDALFERDEQITGAIDDGGILIDNGQIAWVGRWDERPDPSGQKPPVFETGLVTPGWIDCHTHSVFAGERAHEYVLRNTGQSYADILESGGGILETVDHTRRADVDALTDTLEDRVTDFITQGITTLEVKSGYGLELETELRQLEAIRRVRHNDQIHCELVPCFLGAHAIPTEYANKRTDFIERVCKKMIPAAAEKTDGGEPLAEYCDVFCDQSAFSAAEAERILEAGREHGLTGRMHVDELAETDGVRVACRMGIASADHLEYTDPELFEQMAQAGVTGVLMPAVNLTLGTTDKMAKARQMLSEGVDIALSTDFNPGSAPTQDLTLVLSLACTLYGLTPGEALRAVTIGAARALERTDIGRIREGGIADLTLLDTQNMMHVPYHLGANHVVGVVKDGQFAYWNRKLLN